MSEARNVRTAGRRWWLALLVLVFYLLHQDFWLWRAAGPLAFGFLPPGLLYHALYTAAAAALMGLLV
ncbi:MAG: hypothetical protein FJW37_08575, partial [Acidobacteria bacterium]|nr:hypothetical protein [Acidobacteriota bacterium]